MAKQTVAFTNFTAGELSPRLDGRTDVGKYFNGCKTLENMVVHPHGAATRRPGTKFVHEVKTSSEKTRLIPLSFLQHKLILWSLVINIFVFTKTRAL